MLRKLWKTALMAAASYVGDSPLFLMDYLLRLARVLILLSLWPAILGPTGAAGLALSAVLTYTLVAEAFAEQLAVRTELDTALWEGTIAVRLLQPVGIVAQFAADAAGRWAVGLAAFSLPLLLAAPLLGVSPLPAGPMAGLLFVPSLALAIAVGLALEFCFGALLVALGQQVWFVRQLRNALGALLSGSLLPLAVYPGGLGEVFGWLPFAATASAPLRVYTGMGDPLPLLLVQAGWALVLWPAALWLWRANREKLVAFGG